MTCRTLEFAKVMGVCLNRVIDCCPGRYDKAILLFYDQPNPRAGLNQQSLAGAGKEQGVGPATIIIMDPVFHLEIVVPAEAVDRNRHVNNVAYVQWMQDAAIQHSAATGCTRMTEAIGATWVARMHRIEYLRPAFAGEAITVLTWVADFRKVRSLRRYRFIRAADQTVLAQGETDWVLVDAATGRPRGIPGEMARLFEVVPDEPERGGRAAVR